MSASRPRISCPPSPSWTQGDLDAALSAGSRRDHGVSLEGPVRGRSRRRTRADPGGPGRTRADPGGPGRSGPASRVTSPSTGSASRSSAQRARPRCPGPRRPRRRGGATHPGRAQPSRLRRLRRPEPVRASQACAPARRARRSVHVHPRPRTEALNAARAQMHDPAGTRRTQVRADLEGTSSQGVRAFPHAPQPIRRAGQDKLPKGPHGRGDQRPARRALDRGATARQNPGHALPRLAPARRLTSPTGSR